MSIESIRARVNNATPGPWRLGFTDADERNLAIFGPEDWKILDLPKGHYDIEDVDLMGQAAVDIPLLLAVAEAVVVLAEAATRAGLSPLGTNEGDVEKAWDGVDAALAALEAAE